MAAISASVSDVNWRRWLQAWNSSGVILMTVFPQRCNNAWLFPSHKQVYLKSAKNATILPHLLAHLPHILAKETEFWRKREATNGRKSDSPCTPAYVAEAIC